VSDRGGRRRSGALSAQNSPITPVQKMPSILSSPVNRSMSRPSAGSSISPEAANGVVMAAHRPLNDSRAACLASALA